AMQQQGSTDKGIADSVRALGVNDTGSGNDRETGDRDEQHPERVADEAEDAEEQQEEEVPLTLAVNGLPQAVFSSESTRKEFESLFRAIDADCQFNYLRTFRRAQVTMSRPELALLARLRLHRQTVAGCEVSVYFASWAAIRVGENSLLPPQPDKMFLISPPASPPVGWEQHLEEAPVVSYDVLSALASLAPGEDHTLHSASEMHHPDIVVTPCADFDCQADGEGGVNHRCAGGGGVLSKPRIMQTRRPGGPEN
ncbi:hypothetical protein BOX15_Mlig028327g1, partial [Macrostomum lignano]